MELLIDKKYLVRLERYTKFGYGGYYDPFAVRYIFALPKTAGLPDGYTVSIDAQKVEWEHDEKGLRQFSAKPLFTKELERNCTYRLDRDNDVVYEAIMTEHREEGKRYKRYKFTTEELYAIYQNVDLKAAQLAVAKIDIYIDGIEGNRHKAIYGNRIDKTLYLVGKVKGCWFYCSELDTKRRIGSHGVTILGNIKADCEATAWELIRKANTEQKHCKEYYSLVHSPRHSVEQAWQHVKYYCDENNRNAPKDKDILEAVRAVLYSAESAMQLIDKKLSEEDAALAKISAELEKQLKKFYIKEG